MNMRIEKNTEIERWTKPAKPEGKPEPGYAAWLAEEINEGIAELDVGKGFPAAEVWRDLGIE